MDNLLVFSHTEEDHLSHLEMIFKHFKKADLKIKLSKCSFFKAAVEFLGIIVSEHRVTIPKERVEAMQNIKTPKTYTEVNSVLGLMQFTAGFIPAYSEMVKHVR